MIDLLGIVFLMQSMMESCNCFLYVVLIFIAMNIIILLATLLYIVYKWKFDVKAQARRIDPVTAAMPWQEI